MPVFNYHPVAMYDSPRYTATVIDLLSHQGDYAAQAAAMRGQLWGRAVQDIGQTVASFIQQRQEDKRTKAFQTFVDSGEWMQNPQMALAGAIRFYGPERGVKIGEGLVSSMRMMQAKTQGDALKELPVVARALDAAPDSLKPGLYSRARAVMIRAGVGDEQSLPAQHSRDLDPVIHAIAYPEAGKAGAGDYTLTPGGKRFNAQNQVVAEVPAVAPKPPDLTPEEAFYASKGVASPSSEQRAAWRREWMTLSKDPNVADAAAATRETTRTDRLYTSAVSELNAKAKPIEDQAERFDRLATTVEQRTPQADALIAPELLTVMAGGMGSGLRMNEAEISRLIGGRSQLESLKAALNKWQTDPTKALSVTDEQRKQIRSLLGEMRGRLQGKMAAIEGTRRSLANARSGDEVKRLMADFDDELRRARMGGASAGPAPAVGTFKGGDGTESQPYTFE